MSTELLRTDHLTVGYGDKTVAEEISLRAEAGQILTLIGPNGAGKSTLLKTLTRQLSPLSGAVYLSGKDLNSYAFRELAQVSAAVLTEKPRPELMRCEDVVAAGRYPYTGHMGRLSEQDRRIVQETMALVGVTNIASEDFERISDGQRQRILLARAICQEPKLLILDEPTSFLDIRNKLEFLHLLKALVRQKQLAVVMSLHELELAQKFSDQVLCVKDHRADRVGTPEEVFEGDYIQRLYGVEHGSYDAVFGTAEAERIEGDPKVFVIGGGGSGIPIYRRLQRMDIPFAAGVLHENDIDYPVAKALAARIVAERPFETIADERLAEASAILRQCAFVICTLAEFRTMNRANEALLHLAESLGKRIAAEDLPNCF